MHFLINNKFYHNMPLSLCSALYKHIQLTNYRIQYCGGGEYCVELSVDNYSLNVYLFVYVLGYEVNLLLNLVLKL